jgi:hypothetical protein
MKKIIFITLLLLTMTFSISVFAQEPPPPNGGNDPGNNNTPVGGGAPIDGGLTILLLAGLAYGGRKVFQIKNNNN